MDRFFECDGCAGWFPSEDDLEVVEVWDYVRREFHPTHWEKRFMAVCETCKKERLNDPIRGASGLHSD